MAFVFAHFRWTLPDGERSLDSGDGPVSYYPSEEGAGAVQRAGRQNRGEMPDHRRRKSRSSSCEPLQAVARLDK